MMRLKTFVNYLIFALLLITQSACHQGVIFEDNVEIPDYRWDTSYQVVITPTIEDSLMPYHIFINVRNASGYAFSNLFLFLETTAPSGKTGLDTLEITLADETGKWLGDGSGDIWDNRTLFKRNFVFPEAGTYTFKLQQAMRVNPLPQIMDVGLRIEKASQQ